MTPLNVLGKVEISLEDSHNIHSDKGFSESNHLCDKDLVGILARFTVSGIFLYSGDLFEVTSTLYVKGKSARKKLEKS